MDEHTVEQRLPGRRGWLRWRTGLVLVAFLAIAGFFIVSEHRAHAFGVLPYVLLFLSPLLHLFLHGRHGAHGGHRGHEEHGRDPESGAQPPRGEDR